MMSTDPDTFLVEGLTIDSSKDHSMRADILAFPHMSRKDEQLLQTVLNNMSQGVLMFDQETRLIFCNQRYIELYGLSAEVVKPDAIFAIFSVTGPSWEISRATSTSILPASRMASPKARPSIRS